MAWQFEHSVECNVSKSFAWDFWTNVTNWARIEGSAVEWIRINGPFAEGTTGQTKVPGQNPNEWRITQFNAGNSATICMPLEGAEFINVMLFNALSVNRTLITQQLSLVGPDASEMAEGMEIFEKSAPQGLRKLAEAMETAYDQ